MNTFLFFQSQTRSYKINDDVKAFDKEHLLGSKIRKRSTAVISSVDLTSNDIEGSVIGKKSGNSFSNRENEKHPKTTKPLVSSN